MRTTKLLGPAVIAAGLLAVLAVAVGAQSEAASSLEASPSIAPPPAVDPSLGPPEVEGIIWDRIDMRTGTEMAADADEQTLSELDALLAAIGGGYDQFIQLNASATDPETGVIGSYSVIRVVGADAGSLEQALLGLLREASNADEFVFEETQIGGRDATLIRESPERQGVLVVIGDAAYALEFPPERMAAVVEALPE